MIHHTGLADQDIVDYDILRAHDRDVSRFTTPELRIVREEVTKEESREALDEIESAQSSTRRVPLWLGSY